MIDIIFFDINNKQIADQFVQFLELNKILYERNRGVDYGDLYTRIGINKSQISDLNLILINWEDKFTKWITSTNRGAIVTSLPAEEFLNEDIQIIYMYKI